MDLYKHPLQEHCCADFISDEDTDFFEILAGVLQGDTLAPFLFIVSLDYSLRQSTIEPETTGFDLTTRQSSRNPTTYITDADFADDIALLSNTLKQSQLLLQRVESSAREVGLHVNQMKTEYTIYNQVAGEIKTISGINCKKSKISFIFDLGFNQMKETWKPE